MESQSEREKSAALGKVKRARTRDGCGTTHPLCLKLETASVG